MKLRHALLVVALLAAVASRGTAQPATPLADRIPGNAIAYLGWAGADSVGERYDGTKAKALLAKSQLPEAFTAYLPELLDALARENPDARRGVDFANKVGGILWQRPTAIAFGGIDFNSELNDGDPLPRLMVVCDAGDRAGDLRAALTGFLADIGQPQLVTLVREQEGVVYMALGYSDLDLANLAAGGAGSLRAAGPFADAIAQLGGGFAQGTMLTGYADVPAWIELIVELTREEEGEQQAAEVRKVIDAAGLGGLGRLGFATGFDSGDYKQSLFLGVTDRRGALRLVPEPAAALDADLLANVPADATMLAASVVRLDELLPVARALVNDLDPEAAGQIEQGLGFVNMFAGADVEQDVLAQLSGSWVAFVSPRTGDDLFSGVVMQKPAEPDTLRRALRAMSLNLTSVGSAQLRKETDGTLTIPRRTVTVAGHELYTINAPIIAPTWTVTEDVLVATFFPQTTAAALSAGGGFTESPAAAEWLELAGGNMPFAASYADLPRMAPRTYPALLIASQVGFGAGDLFGDFLRTRPPVMAMPSLPDVVNHLRPSMSVAWVDGQGVHVRSVEPFPLSGLLLDFGNAGSQLSQVGSVVGVQAAVLLPSLNRAREAANRVKSASNLRQIGQLAVEHAIHDRQGSRFPPDFETLVTSRELPAELFVNPRGGTVAPAGAGPAAAGKWVAKQSDYVYLGGGLRGTAGPSVLLAYEDPEAFDYEDGLNVLYADGSVRFVRFDEFARLADVHREHRRKVDKPLDPALDETLRRHVEVGVRQSQ